MSDRQASHVRFYTSRESALSRLWHAVDAPSGGSGSVDVKIRIDPQLRPRAHTQDGPVWQWKTQDADPGARYEQLKRKWREQRTRYGTMSRRLFDRAGLGDPSESHWEAWRLLIEHARAALLEGHLHPKDGRPPLTLDEITWPHPEASPPLNSGSLLALLSHGTSLIITDHH